MSQPRPRPAGGAVGRGLKVLRSSALGATALGATALTWALIEARAYTLREFDLPILPPGHTPLRVLHLSDLHLLPTDHRRIEWVKGLARHNPDIVFTTGDNFSHPGALPAVIEAMSPFLDLPGGFVTGSNDYYPPVLKNPFAYLRARESAPRPTSGPSLPAGDLIAALKTAGWAHLDNARAQITVQGTTIDLVGTGDAHIDAARYPPPSGRPPIDAGGTAHLRIGVTHAPYTRVLERMRLDRVDLALAGHTHGGQVCLPGYGALVTNCDLDRRMAKGVHEWPAQAEGLPAEERLWLHVSAGLGTSPFTPIRFACRPEASLLTLHPA